MSNLFAFFSSSQWLDFVFWAKIVAFVLSVSLVIFIGVVMAKLNRYNFPSGKYREDREDERPAASRVALGPWNEILTLIQSPNPADWSIAVLKADSLVDMILKRMQLKGQTMGERLRSLDKSQLLTLDELWEAHRIRNDIVHSPKKSVSQHMANHAVMLYGKVLGELGYIEG